MGDIRFMFHVLQLLPIKFTRENLCCISTSTMQHPQVLDKKLDFSLFSFDYRKCTFVDSLTEYMGPLNCVQTSMLSLK